MTTCRNDAGGTRAGKPSGIFFPIGNISRVNLGIFSRSGIFSRTILRNTPTAGMSRGEGAGGVVGRGAALAAAAALVLVAPAATRTATAQTAGSSATTVPDLAAVAAFEGSSLARVVDRFSADWGALQRKWADLPYSPARQQRVRDFLAEWADALDGLRLAADDVEGSIDHTLLSAEIRYRQ